MIIRHLRTKTNQVSSLLFQQKFSKIRGNQKKLIKLFQSILQEEQEEVVEALFRNIIRQGEGEPEREGEEVSEDIEVKFIILKIEV